MGRAIKPDFNSSIIFRTGMVSSFDLGFDLLLMFGSSFRPETESCGMPACCDKPGGFRCGEMPQGNYCSNTAYCGAERDRFIGCNVMMAVRFSVNGHWERHKNFISSKKKEFLSPISQQGGFKVDRISERSGAAENCGCTPARHGMQHHDNSSATQLPSQWGVRPTTIGAKWTRWWCSTKIICLRP